MVEGVLYGFHPIRETLRREPHRVEEVLLGARRGSPRRLEIEALCERHRVAYRGVSGKELSEWVDGTHNGFVARMAKASEQDVGTTGDPQLVVLVEDVQDPRNLGALLRVCEGAGVGKVLIRDRGSAPITALVEKTAAGATQWLPIDRITNSSQTLGELKKEGFWTYATVPGGEVPWTVDLAGPVVLCFGGEEKGLRPRTRKTCDGTLGLPMKGRIQSLNLATAVSAILYEVLRQRSS